MKIYFTASARGTKQFQEHYKKIYDSIKKLGHTHLDDLVFNIDQNSFYDGTHEKRVMLYKKAMGYIKKADIVILDVSIHSLSMGYVMQKALENSKPVIALYRKGYEPYFASGIENDKLQVIEYRPEEIKRTLQLAIEYAQEQQDTRFNFFISPRHQAYLDWIAKNRKIPRSVYLRDLIETDMDNNTNYN